MGPGDGAGEMVCAWPVWVKGRLGQAHLTRACAGGQHVGIGLRSAVSEQVESILREKTREIKAISRRSRRFDRIAERFNGESRASNAGRQGHFERPPSDDLPLQAAGRVWRPPHDDAPA